MLKEFQYTKTTVVKWKSSVPVNKEGKHACFQNLKYVGEFALDGQSQRKRIIPAFKFFQCYLWH